MSVRGERGRLVLSGGDLILPGRMLASATLVIEDDRIADIAAGAVAGGPADATIDCRDCYVAPGFVDVHVHGVEGVDSLDGSDAIGEIARRLPRFGVTAFCPTSVACAPSALRLMLAAVRAARSGPPDGARVLPAHLESNFINPEYRGAQPIECLRLPRRTQPDAEFSGRDILDEIAAARTEVGIVTLAPELDGAIDLVKALAGAGHRVSLGHSGASYETAVAAADAGARHATHLFNRMTPINHRDPGLAAAVLERDDVAAELICDGVHVHPAMIKLALAAKSPAGVMAVSDGTAGSGLRPGDTARLGGRAITVGDAAYLADGTLAGSVLTMDRAFAMLVSRVRLSLVDAVAMCATTPARRLGLEGFGFLAPGAAADVVVLDRELRVKGTYVAGRAVFGERP
jgi:N-acetylglucosamine-6-phosphate deacetylase